MRFMETAQLDWNPRWPSFSSLFSSPALSNPEQPTHDRAIPSHAASNISMRQ